MHHRRFLEGNTASSHQGQAGRGDTQKYFNVTGEESEDQSQFDKAKAGHKARLFCLDVGHVMSTGVMRARVPSLLPSWGSLGLVPYHLDQTIESLPCILTYSERLNSDLEHRLLLITPPTQSLIFAQVEFG